MWVSRRISTRSSPCLLINPHHDRIEDIFNFLLFIFVAFRGFIWMGIQPFLSRFNKILESGFFISTEFIFQFLIIHRVTNRVGIVLETILSFNLLFNLLILCLIFLSFFYKSIYFGLIKSALLICNCDFIALIWSFINCSYIHNTIFINIKGNFNLRHTSRGRCNSFQSKLA